ncbi:hypothetical protein BV898_10494 [Hypsibius exemplaris]|uniref:Receptor ligand binding region domain-containing protein n=1 Tax=Hypsibius exemplaris TaxID=2072580 RepID=A0A1W0WJ61_HYPEX|nr:hypothetical protein BV898_10494 [Hypsibius exemplaris]
MFFWLLSGYLAKLSYGHAVVGTVQQPAAEIVVVAFGSPVTVGLGALSRSTVVWEMAVADLAQKYGDALNISYIFVPAVTCLAVCEKGEDVLSGWYYTLQRPGRVLVFLNNGADLATPGGYRSRYPSLPDCNANDISLYMLSAQWNVLAVNSLTSIEIDRTILPTTLSLGFLRTPSYVRLCQNLLTMYNWTSMFILLDKGSVPINTFVASALAERLNNSGRVTFVLRTVLSNANTTFRDNLIELRSFSRILFFFGHAAKLRQLLVTASSMNMTNGQYVYVAMEALPNFIGYGKMSWRYSDKNDQVARVAFRSLLVLQPDISSFKTTNSSFRLANEFRSRSMASVNINYTNADHPSEIVITTYDAVMLLGKVLHEAWRSQEDLTDSRNLIQRFLNQTFDMDSESIFIDSNGVRADNLVVAHYNSLTDQREPFLLQPANAADELNVIRSLEDWPSLKWPPSSSPGCEDGDADKCRVAGLKTSEIWNSTAGRGG